MKSTHRSIIDEADSVYMSEGLSDILYASEESPTEISQSDIRAVTIQEEGDSRTVTLVMGSKECGEFDSLRLFGKKVVIRGIPALTKFKVTSVTYDRTVSTVVLLGSMLNT